MRERITSQCELCTYRRAGGKVKILVVYDQVLSSKEMAEVKRTVKDFIENEEVSTLILCGGPRIILLEDEDDG
jgi:predicted ATP-grasp superfamily ATP-dependent carboligase